MKKEVKKVAHKGFRAKTFATTRRFRSEFKKYAITAITAAFAFLVALSWREPISKLFSKIIEDLGLSENIIYYEFLSAILITIMAVLLLMLISKWASKPVK